MCSISWIISVPTAVIALEQISLTCKFSSASSYHKMLSNLALPKDLIFLARSLHPCSSQPPVSSATSSVKKSGECKC